MRTSSERMPTAFAALPALSAACPAAVARAAVAADFHQPLDVHRDLFAEVAFDAALLFDHAADLADIVFGQILHPHVGTDAGILQDAVRADAPDAEDIGEADFDPL